MIKMNEMPHLHRACHSEGERARSRQLELTLEAVARSVGERRERMARLTGAGSRNSGSEQPRGHRWCRPGEHQGSVVIIQSQRQFKVQVFIPKGFILRSFILSI